MRFFVSPASIIIQMLSVCVLVLLAISLSKNAIAFTTILQIHQRHITASSIFHQSLHGSKTLDLTIHHQTPLFATPPNIQISQAQSNSDLISLADLRYQEWIIDSEDNMNNRKSSTMPSQTSFRLATAEIHHERRAEGATVFLARYHNEDGTDRVVGAAELSPIETRDCILYNNLQEVELNASIAMYATDVVTSSSHRRLGIGSKLMTALEDYAWNLGCRFILLHVEYNNALAIEFYHRLGYVNVTEHCTADTEMKTDDGMTILYTDSTNIGAALNESDNSIITIMTHQLAINAGTIGQLLMVKRLQAPKDNEHVKVVSNPTSGIKAPSGFGSKEVAVNMNKLRKKKRVKKK
jgi:GNAT superfamily N-acetyltransferase